MRGAVPEHSLRNGGMSALTITAIYLAAGGLWILFSDAPLHAMVTDETHRARLQTFKGWFYVAATGVMLYFLIGRSTTAVRGANRALRRNDEDLRTILNTIPALVFVTDAEGRLPRYNPLFASATGLPRDELVGKVCTELFRLNDGEITRTGQPKLNMVERVETGEGSK